jgi:Uma2 family endonuclease
MVDRGILTEDDPVELLEGLLVRKMSKNPPHSTATRKTRSALQRALPSGFYVDSQEPVMTLDSEPEPDVLILRGDETTYATRHPGPGDVPVLVEVADATLETDRLTKRRIYARAGFPVYWIVNLIDRVVEVYTQPSGPADVPTYARQDNYAADASIPLTIDGKEITQLTVADLLP